MAATVEGVFRLIDRASGPLRKIEAQAKKTEMALKSAGGNLDHIGDNKQLRSLDETERKMRNVSRGTQVLDKDLDRTRRTTRRSSREFDGLSGSLRRLAGAFAGLRALRMPIMFGGILAAIKPLVAIVGALGGGVVALVPKLTDLAGVAGALPATFLGIGLAIGTAKLAFADLGKALGGNKKAMAALTPEARSFVRTLKQYKPVLQDIRREAQKGLFPGLEYSIRRLQRAVPMVQRLVGRMGRAMGGEAKGWANFLTTGGNLRDLERLGNQGIRIFRRISQGARNIAAALIDVASAARPFTEWLTKTLLRGTRQFRDFVHHGRETGKLAAFFDRTKDALKRFWSIATNLWNVFRGISKAARPLGEDLWRSLDRITRGWARWVDSTKGRGDLNAWFSGLRPTLRELGGLVGDLSKALFRMTGPQSQNQTAGMIGQIREWIPVLERIFDNATKVFGPAMLDAIKQLGRTIEILLSGGAGGALTMLLNTFTTILTAVNDLMDKFPALGRIITAALTVLGLSRLMTRIASFGGEVGGLATKWWGVKRAADAAAGAEARAMGGGTGPLGGGPIIGPGSRGGGARPRPLPGETVSPGGVILPGAATRGGGSVAAPAGRFARLRAGVTAGRAARAGGGGLRAIGGAAATGAGLRGAAGLGLRGAAGIGLRAAGAAGGFLWPVAALSAGIGALTTKGTATERTLGAVRGATMGLWNDPITRKEHRDKAEAALATKLSDLPGGLDVDPRGLDVPTLQKRTGRLRQEIGAEKAKEGATKVVAGTAGVHRVAAGPNKVEHEATMKRLTDEYNAEREILKAEQARAKAQRNIALNAVSREKAKNLLVDLGHAFDIWAKKRTPEIAMQKTVSGALEKIRTMRPAGARIVAQNTLEWAKEQAKHNPKFLKEVDKLERGIKTRFSRVGHHVRIVNGQILTGSKGEWKSIADSLITQTERAAEETAKGFTKIQQQAIGSLQAMGFDKANATRIVRDIQHGGRRGKVATWQAKNPTAPAATSPMLTQNRPGDGPGDTGARAPHTGGPADVRAPSAKVGATAAAAGAGGGNLMGANPNLAPYAQIASTYGLHVSSGARPGAITSSGNVSWHSSGHAIDVSGPASGMMSFFQAMKSQYGAGLEELIYTPGGVGIKNGQPFTYTGQVAADHFDHVHVADKDPGGVAGGLPGGAPGPGGMMQIPGLTAPGATNAGLPGAAAQTAMDMYAGGLTTAINGAIAGGTAPGAAPAVAGKYDAASLAQLWISAGGTPSAAPLMARIALAESGGNPGIGNAGRTPNGTTVAAGLWQILGLPFPGDPTDPMTNARMAVAKYNAGGTAPWNASKGAWGDGLGAPQTMSVNGGSPRAPVLSSGKGGGGGTMHVAINIHGGSNVEAQVHRALVKVARELELVPLEDT